MLLSQLTRGPLALPRHTPTPWRPHPRRRMHLRCRMHLGTLAQTLGARHALSRGGGGSPLPLQLSLLGTDGSSQIVVERAEGSGKRVEARLALGCVA